MLAANLFTNDFFLTPHLYSTPPRDPQDRRKPRQSLRDCAIATLSKSLQSSAAVLNQID